MTDNYGLGSGNRVREPLPQGWCLYLGISMEKHTFIIISMVLILVSFPLSVLPQDEPFHFNYSTYLGGANDDYGWAIAVDSGGLSYVCGNTSSGDFPTASAYQSGWNGSADAFVTKFTTSGSEIIYSTYLGGADNDYGYSIAVDSDGSAYLCGSTSSSDFPTVNPYQASFAGGTDIFITILSSDGGTLDYSSYMGGSGEDEGYGIALSAEKIYVTGYTASADFPTREGYQPSLDGGSDAFFSIFY